MFRIMLNIAKKDNFVFFDQENRVHLNLTTPIGYANVVSDSLYRALVNGAVIDVDSESGVEIPTSISEFNDKVLLAFNVKKKVKEVIVDEPIIEVIEEVNEVVEVVEEVKAPKKKSKGGKKNG